ncbi:MAG: FeoB-associated Cys-rich membrane protein [Clostridia bacterium]|nr:FeoB-associated Cys-rich membrane protein [Clostridia bacterium]MBR5009905.1 FeoB-associated Cys-rich membrane protein [Clostridia bacterium]MBR5986159.1 FeoB-associated Cys-rich membrane protein [Clostridia bacterium]MBR6007506.1 FeoB-associated Cys-rich membrane protein [Clostridia bacterium]
MNTGTVLALAAVILAAGGAFAVLRRDKKRGKSPCGGNCGCCPSCGACHKAQASGGSAPHGTKAH